MSENVCHSVYQMFSDHRVMRLYLISGGNIFFVLQWSFPECRCSQLILEDRQFCQKALQTFI